MAADETRLAGELSLSIVRFARHLRSMRQHSLISLTNLSALNVLASDGPLTPGQLATRERIRPPSMTRIVGSLTELGLIKRIAHPTDGRQVIVSLSEEGEQLIESESAAREEWLRSKLDALAPEERKVLREAADLLTTLIDADQQIHR